MNLELEWGRCLVVLGPNGAGKTTLLRVLATLVKPDSGTVHVAGYDRRRQPVQVRSAVGFLSHQSFLYDELTPRENLRFYARLYGVPDVEERVSRVLGQVEIGGWAERRVRTLSNGMQKRVALARALLHRPRVLLLDEPETGLDQRGLEVLADALRGVLDDGASVVMTTHAMERGLALADQVAVLVEGRLVLHAPTTQVDLPSLRELVGRQGNEAP